MASQGDGGLCACLCLCLARPYHFLTLLRGAGYKYLSCCDVASLLLKLPKYLVQRMLKIRLKLGLNFSKMKVYIQSHSLFPFSTTVTESIRTLFQRQCLCHKSFSLPTLV